MRRSKLFVGMPVISLEEGHQVGEIRGLVINPAQKNVAALIIEPKGFFREQKFIPFSKVHTIGDDVITIDKVSRVERGISLPEILRLLKERVPVVGCRMVTEGGTNLGVVDEYYIDLKTGEIVGLEFSGGAVSNLFKGSAYLDINHIRTIGSSVIICSDSAMDNIAKIDGGLKETLRSFSENTGQIFETTFKKTKGWSQSLNNSLSMSIEKMKKSKKSEDPLTDEEITQQSLEEEEVPREDEIFEDTQAMEKPEQPTEPETPPLNKNVI